MQIRKEYFSFFQFFKVKFLSKRLILKKKSWGTSVKVVYTSVYHINVYELSSVLKKYCFLFCFLNKFIAKFKVIVVKTGMYLWSIELFNGAVYFILIRILQFYYGWFYSYENLMNFKLVKGSLFFLLPPSKAAKYNELFLNNYIKMGTNFGHNISP